MSDTVLVTEKVSTDIIYTDGSVETVVALPEGTSNVVTTDQGEVTVVETKTGSTTVIESTQIGPQGIPGTTSGVTSSFEAGETLSGHRSVIVVEDKAYYADCTIPGHANSVYGITKGAALIGSTVIVQRSSELEEPSWSWVVGIPIWLSTAGLLTQSPPSSGFSLILGFPITSTKLFINIREPIFLI